jgi:hypothetical protein
MEAHDTDGAAGILMMQGGRPIPCWECLKPASEAIDGHPYCAACIVVGVPQKTRYLPGQEDKRASRDAGEIEWTGR